MPLAPASVAVGDTLPLSVLLVEDDAVLDDALVSGDACKVVVMVVVKLGDVVVGDVVGSVGKVVVDTPGLGGVDVDSLTLCVVDTDVLTRGAVSIGETLLPAVIDVDGTGESVDVTEAAVEIDSVDVTPADVVCVALDKAVADGLTVAESDGVFEYVWENDIVVDGVAESD